MSDRLEETKKWVNGNNELGVKTAKRLISELEECRAENKELWAVFNLQATRTKKAEHLWQQATGKHDTLPDLGVLMDWLMGEIKQLEQLINDWLEDKDE